MKKGPREIIVITVISLFLVTCKDEYTICNLSRNVNFNAGFYQRLSGADVSVVVPGLTVYLLNNSSSPIFNNQQNARSFSLPLEPFKDSSRYVISITSGQPDTLTIVYNTVSATLSEACGSVFHNNLIKVYSTANTLDSARIVNPAVTSAGLENARIYF
ncbi:MAG: DUF6452 family protein [Ferruginibacter sp.]